MSSDAHSFVEWSLRFAPCLLRNCRTFFQTQQYRTSALKRTTDEKKLTWTKLPNLYENNLGRIMWKTIRKCEEHNSWYVLVTTRRTTIQKEKSKFVAVSFRNNYLCHHHTHSSGEVDAHVHFWSLRHRPRNLVIHPRNQLVSWRSRTVMLVKPIDVVQNRADWDCKFVQHFSDPKLYKKLCNKCHTDFATKFCDEATLKNKITSPFSRYKMRRNSMFPIHLCSSKARQYRPRQFVCFVSQRSNMSQKKTHFRLWEHACSMFTATKIRRASRSVTNPSLSCALLNPDACTHRISFRSSMSRRSWKIVDFLTFYQCMIHVERPPNDNDLNVFVL